MKFSAAAQIYSQDISESCRIQFPDLQVCGVEDTADPQGVQSRNITVASGLDPIQVVSAVAHRRTKALIQKNERFFSDDIRVSAQFAMDPRLYFQGRSDALIPSPTDSRKLQFAGPGQKSAAKDQCLSFVKGELSNVQESIDALFEEFYMNAMFDAPSEAKKQGRAYDLYEKGDAAVLSLARDDKRIAFSCFDPYGSMHENKFLLRLEEVLNQGAGNVINMRDRGAGIGCSIIYEHSMFLMMGVIPGQCTMVTAFVPLGLSHRQRAKLQKSLQVVAV
jgi:hypothetical protein